MKIKRVPFIWDYDLGEEDLYRILQGPESYQKDWLITRIIKHASWKEIWHYLDLKTIQEHLDHLILPAPLKEHWQYALKQWQT